MTGAVVESMITPALFGLVAGFLLWFWFSRHGAASLSRLAGGELPVDLCFFYNPEKLYRHLEAYGEAGRRSFRLTQLVDLAYPLFYGAAFWSLSGDMEASGLVTAGGRAAICLMTAVAALSDYAEDALLLVILKVYPARRDTLARLAAGCTFIKAVSSYAAILWVTGAVVKGAMLL